MKNIYHKYGVIAAFLTGSLIVSSVSATQDSLPPEIANEVSKYQGISILPLDQHSIPDQLKQMTRNNIQQMKNKGYISSKGLGASKLDEINQKKGKYLKPLNKLIPQLTIEPSNLSGTELEFPGTKLLGVMPSGGMTETGISGLFRLMEVPKLGLVGLNEVDYKAGNGGMIMIEEAINCEINGLPAVLTVKKGTKNGESELRWASDKKLYTLTTNRAVTNQKSIENFLNFARSIVE